MFLAHQRKKEEKVFLLSKHTQKAKFQPNFVRKKKKEAKKGAGWEPLSTW